MKTAQVSDAASDLGQVERGWRAKRNRGEALMVPSAQFRSYYDQPIIKKPVWRWFIPSYFFTGGLAGASGFMALVARLSGDRRLARHGRLTALVATLVSGGLLISDLGRPGRFFNMLRVVRPTSPMSMGTWILSVFGPAMGVAAASDLTGFMPSIGACADVVGGVAGVAVATYTAVLIADTAVPVWRESGTELPFVFGAGATASAGGLALALSSGSTMGPARRVAMSGAVAELVATQVMEKRLGPLLAEPYKQGPASGLARAARWATASGLVAVGLGRRRDWLVRLGGALIVAGAATERFSIFHAGVESARDPKYTVIPQRRRLDQELSNSGNRNP